MKWQNKCINIDHSPLQENVVVIGNISSLQTTLYVIWSISDQTKSDTENFGHLIAVVYILWPLHRFFSAFLAPHPPFPGTWEPPVLRQRFTFSLPFSKSNCHIDLL